MHIIVYILWHSLFDLWTSELWTFLNYEPISEVPEIPPKLIESESAGMYGILEEFIRGERNTRVRTNWTL